MLRGKYIDALRRKGIIINGSVSFPGFRKFKITRNYLYGKDRDKVCVLESNGKKFEYWIDQDIVIPPWVTHWFQLEDLILVKLKDGLLEKLIQAGIRKAGNLFRFTKSIEMSCPTFYNFLNKKRSIEMISVGKLRRILAYLGMRYEAINGKIEYTKKGDVISIKSPKFPINLATDEGAKILGHVVSDGCVYVDKKARGCVRTKYSTGERESIEGFIRLINSVYGETHIQKERVRNCDVLKIGSSIIGTTLLKAGAILGHKASVDGELPWLILYGPENLKKKYLQAVFEDEGSIYVKKGDKHRFITLSRNRHVNNISGKHLRILRQLEKSMAERRFPTGHVNKTITIKRALEKTEYRIQPIMIPPKILVAESELLSSMGIENRIHGTSLSKTSLGKYSLCYSLFVNKKMSIIKFYKEVGFPLSSKQRKLEEAIEDIGEVGGNKVV